MDEEDILGPDEPDVPATEVPEGSVNRPSRIDRRLKRKSSFYVGKQIAQAFREELLTGTHQKSAEDAEEETEEDYSTFCVPKNTRAIAIDNSTFGRRQLGRFLEFLGIPADHRIVVGHGYDQIMGFE